MILAAMRFNGYTWHHNPKEINISCMKNVKDIGIPFESSILQNFGRKNRVISGTGELFGKDCMQQFKSLWQLYSSSQNGILSVPDLPPVYAEFTKLAIKGDPKPDFLTYTFEFCESMQNSPDSLAQLSYTVKNDGETLWDIAFEFNTTVDSLVKLNPYLKFPDELIKGTQVVLI